VISFFLWSFFFLVKIERVLFSLELKKMVVGAMVSYGLSRLNHGCFFCCLCVVVIVIFPLILQ